MNESLKVKPHHLERGAYLYIRQSSMKQVIENVESTKRQYALRTRATALGWADDQIIVIDSDQGVSGASAAWREGFQRLVTDVSMGRAGIVMGLEVSRLARNNADWHRLLEICALADTLILDEDGVYDPGASGGIADAMPRIGAVTSGWDRKASTRRRSPHCGQVVTSGPQTLRRSAAQSSRRANMIAVGAVVGSSTTGVGTTRARSRWAEAKIPWNLVV